MGIEPPNSPPKKAQNGSDTFRHDLVRINKKAIFVLFSMVFGQFLLANHVADAGEMTEEALLECTNAIRAHYQDQPLYLSEQLATAAAAKLEDMQAYDYWAHGNPVTGEMPWDFVDRAGYIYRTTGENLALGFDTGQEVCDAWEASETHLANIADKDFQEVGFAIDKANLHKNGKGILVVQMFGSRDNFTPPQQRDPREEECLTAQGCELKKGSESKVLGAEIEKNNSISTFISDNIAVFVIICSYLIGKILLTFFYDQEAVRVNRKKRNSKKQ